MRCLTPLRLQVPSVKQICGSQGHIAGVAVDPESETLFVTIETVRSGEGVEIQVVQVEPSHTGEYSVEVIATFDSPVLAPFNIPDSSSQLLDVHYFPDDRSLTILLRGGDIATLQLEGPDGSPAPVEIVGSIDSGIKAAAWSPDDEQLVMITGEDMLVCMTRTFDTVHEEPLRSEEFGEDAFINVGWGSKQTQFHGSLGKAAAKADPAAALASQSQNHPTDDGLPTITFRGDAAFFAISSLDSYGSENGYSRRQIRIYSRDASAGFIPKLSATSENLPGLEGSMDWRPSGNLIAGLVRYGYDGGAPGNQGRWEVAMLERNGLRHGGFPLREGLGNWEKGRVRKMSWNSDSEVLGIWIEREDGDVVQLWSMKNCHYYLKQEIVPRSENGRFRGFRWHSEQPLSIYLFEDNLIQLRSFVWDTYTARLPMPHDTASVAVVDGDRLLITPFRTQNTPPPMSSYTINLPATPCHISMSHSSDSVTVLLRDRLQIWDLNTRLPGPKGSKLRGGGKVAEPSLRWEGMTKGTNKQVYFSADEVAVLALDEEGNQAVITSWKDGELQNTVPAEADVERILWSEPAGWLILDALGTLASLDSQNPLQLSLCAKPTSISTTGDLVFALSPTGKLLGSLISSDASPINIATAVTSFTTTPDFLIYTTSSQTSYYASLSILRQLADGEAVSAHEQGWESRRVERGSLIVTACPSEMSLVLQMPRGNLETIYPRPMVLAVVRRDVLAGSYRSAFMICRKHRLDLNVLYDLDPKQFMENLEKFVEQVPEVDYLNLFVSSLSDKDASLVLYRDLGRNGNLDASSPEKVNSICDNLRKLLEARDLVKYTETILTTHVCKMPADYEAGLRVLLQLQTQHPDIVEDAIKYIIFLSDVNQLFDVALGMYNFQLVLMIAQYSQKDPKEYLPFLRELKSLDRHEQRFRIDDHLGRRASALRNLKEAGPKRFDEAASYLARYELYDEAFRLYADDQENLPVVYDLYGDYLYDRREFAEAALAYQLASKAEKTLKALEKAHAWRELFTLALQQKLPKQIILELSGRVTDHLSSRGKSLEAAQILIDYAEDVDSAVETLCRGAEFSEAYRLTSKHNRPDLIEDTIHPGLTDASEALTEVFEEMDGQLEKEMNRLEALRQIRLEDPDTFFLVDAETALEGVDVATNATTAVSAFTRYTVAPTTVFSQSTRITGQTAKSKHKISKKRAAGRKGTVDEYDYLVASIGRLVIRVDEKSDDAVPLLKHLVVASPEHKELAKDLQSTILSFRKKLSNSIIDAWRDRESILDEVHSSGGMGLGGDNTKAKEVEQPSVKAWKGLGVLAS